MTDAEKLLIIAEKIADVYPDLTLWLRVIAVRVRRQERVLDEIAEQARVDARVANTIAVEHLRKYRAP